MITREILLSTQQEIQPLAALRLGSVGVSPLANLRVLWNDSARRTCSPQSADSTTMTSTNSRLALALVVSSAILSGSGISAQQAAPPQRPAGPIEVNGIAAKVNGRVVTKNQVTFMLAPVFAQLSAQFPRRGPQFEAKFKE